MLDLLDGADDETREALASVAYGIGEKLFPVRDTFTTRAAFRAALLRECEAYAETDALGFMPGDAKALRVLFDIMREALEPSFVGDLPDPDAH